MHSKRGQASTEIIILFAIVLVIALATLPSVLGESLVGQKVTAQESEDYWYRADLGLSAPYFGDGASGKITLWNNKRFAITFVNISDEAGNLVSGSANENRAVQAGQQYSVTTHSSGRPCDGKESGAEYELKPAIFYKDASSPARTYVFRGSKPLSGNCR